MSLDLHTFLDVLPGRESWQAAIDKIGIDLKLDPDLDLSHHEGFSPCQLRGKPSGFEVSVTATSEVLRDYPSLLPAVGSRPHVVSFRWGGDMAECACVLGANLALLRHFKGVAYYPPDDLLYDVDQLEEELRQSLAVS
jgi:hypothetical protein